MCSYPPVEAAKLQLAVEQPLTEGLWNPLKRILPSKDKEKPQQDGRRGAVKIKSNPIPAGWVTHRLEYKNTKEVLTLL